MALQRGRLVKRVHTGTAQPAKYEGTEEPEGMADAPIERLLKDIIKKKEPEVIEIEADNHVVQEKSFKKSASKRNRTRQDPNRNLQPAVIKHQSHRSFRPT